MEARGVGVGVELLLLWCASELDLGAECIFFPTSTNPGCVHLAELAGTKT